MIRLTVRDRIFVMIIGVGTVIFSLLLAAVYTHTTRAFKESLGEELHRLAQQMASRIDLSLTNEIEKEVVLAQRDKLREAVEDANRSYEGLSPGDIQKKIERIDKEWSLSDEYRHLYERSLNPTVELLARYQSIYPDKVAELFVTDIHGALLASTNRTTDYEQADEGWWREAFNGGRGAVYVGGFELDESSRAYGVTIAVPVMDRQGTRAVGVLKSVVDVHRLLEMVAGYRLGETGHVHLIDASGEDIFKSAEVPNRFLHFLAPELVRGLLERNQTHALVTDQDDKRFIAGFAAVRTPETLGPATFGGQGWHVLVLQELGEAYSPVYRLMKTLLALGLVALVALYLTVLITARTITKPLGRLRRGTQRVRDGHLEHRVELQTGDELQELAESFNEMTEKLKVSYEDLRNRTRELEHSLNALGQSEERYRAVLETSRSGIVVCDEEGLFPIFNPSFAEMLGYDIEEAKRVRFSDFIHPEDVPMVDEHRRDCLEGRCEPVAFEMRCKTKGGVEIIAEVSQGPYAPAGEVVGVIWELRDITKRRKAERELKVAHEELKVAYAALEQAQAAAIIAEKLAAVGRLTAGVSHEVLNPLNIITMRLYLMINDPATPKEVVGPLRILDEQAQRIAKIIKELLYFARQRPPDRRPTDLNEVLRRTLSLMGPDMRLANIELKLDFDDELPQVLVDQDQLHQVMLNLLTNAQEAMPAGGCLSLHTETVRANGKRWVELRVMDTGEGIDPAHRDKIFEPFFTTKPEGEGNGLGLAICKGIIDSHGGSMWAEDNPGGGAVFVVRLEVDGG